MFNGDKLKIMLFGESHGRCVGVCIEGIPYGIELNVQKIAEYSRKRKGIDALSTARREADNIEIMSGIMDGFTTGGPICALIPNEDTRSKDYTPNIPRPSHADLTAIGRYGGYNDYRGGGMFSGRLTAALVFAGAVCDSILEQKNVTSGVHVVRIRNAWDDTAFDMVNIDADTLKQLNKMDIPVFSEKAHEAMKREILSAKDSGDSVGGMLECAVVGYPPFIGSNYFGRLNSKIAGLVFSIPAFCSLEFGAGLVMAEKRGSEVNDGIYIDENGNFRTETNNSGGINGGISNGMPIILRTTVKPTPSIYKEQNTIDINAKTNVKYTVRGRHDPCIALRAGIVLRSMVNIALLDSMLGDKL